MLCVNMLVTNVNVENVILICDLFCKISCFFEKFLLCSHYINFELNNCLILKFATASQTYCVDNDFIFFI